MTTHRILRATLLFFVMAFSMVAAFAQSPDYRLGPDDIIVVNVLRHPEYSGDFLVPQDGSIDFLAAGTVHVEGMTLKEVKDTILKALTDRLINPEVSVTLRQARVRKFAVYGEVRLPGSFDLRPGWRISNALASAQGIPLGQRVDDVTVIVTRKSGQRVTVPLTEILHGDPSRDVVLEEGDTVIVEALMTVPVYVVGAVARPGVVDVRQNGVGILAAISIAGGFMPDASTANVTVTHADGTVQRVDLTPSRTGIGGPGGIPDSRIPLLRAGDLINVAEIQNRIMIMGWVKQPGVFPLHDGKVITIADAISLGQVTFSNRARLSRVAVVSAESGHAKHVIYDFGKFLRSGDTSQNPPLKPGDVVYVPETNAPDIGPILQAIEATAILLQTRR